MATIKRIKVSRKDKKRERMNDNIKEQISLAEDILDRFDNKIPIDLNNVGKLAELVLELDSWMLTSETVPRRYIE